MTVKNSTRASTVTQDKLLLKVAIQIKQRLHVEKKATGLSGLESNEY